MFYQARFDDYIDHRLRNIDNIVDLDGLRLHLMPFHSMTGAPLLRYAEKDFIRRSCLDVVRDGGKEKGRLLRPTGLKTDRVEVSLFPSIGLEEERRKDFKPIAVGSIEAYPERLDANLSIPLDALVPILQMLIAGRLKFVVMRGSKLRYRSARLHSYTLGSKLDEDDATQLEAAG
ncbi:hypothetical protein ACVME5_007844 [Bradyrhizobium liaoningense]